MKKFGNFVKRLFFVLWGLPQSILAFFFRIYWVLFDGSFWTNADVESNVFVEKYEGATIFWVSRNGENNFSGVSLGEFIFINQTMYDDKNIRGHEFGHTIQSRILGPLYLFVVGIPSAINAIRSLGKGKELAKKRIEQFHETGETWTYEELYGILEDWYYELYPEKWADKLGKVERK